MKLNATQIKVIAIIAMTIDHIAYAFVPSDSLPYFIMRFIGKLTAPLMCFFLAEGFTHTRNRKKYFLRLFSFALISQPAYYLFIYKDFSRGLFHFLINWNVMFTLAVSLICLAVMTSSKLNSILKIILFAIVFSLAQFGDWSYMIPIWTIIFFILRNDRKKQLIIYSLASLIVLPVLFLKYFSTFISFTYLYGSLIVPVVLNFYDSKRIKSDSKIKRQFSKWFFYLYYPLHLMIIILI